MVPKVKQFFTEEERGIAKFHNYYGKLDENIPM